MRRRLAQFRTPVTGESHCAHAAVKRIYSVGDQALRPERFQIPVQSRGMHADNKTCESADGKPVLTGPGYAREGGQAVRTG